MTWKKTTFPGYIEWTCGPWSVYQLDGEPVYVALDSVHPVCSWPTVSQAKAFAARMTKAIRGMG